MNAIDSLRGVFAASITPLLPDLSPDLDNLAPFLGFLARRGCHGALILGTTGEGPSFSPSQRRTIMLAASQVRQEFPDFRLLAGAGTPSLEETIDLCSRAFDLGYDGVVVLPPYYFRKANEDGLFTWFSEVLSHGVPEWGAFFAYHIPGMTGVPLSLDLLARLKDAFPDQFCGLKDSSADPETARSLGQRFGGDLLVYNGSDALFSTALENHAGGCITARANVCSPTLRRVWDAFQAGAPHIEAQTALNAARAVMDAYSPNPPLYKALLHRRFDWPRWRVCPPLSDLPEARLERALAEALAAAPQLMA